MLDAILDLLKKLVGFQPTIVNKTVSKYIEANGSAHAAGDLMSETDSDGLATPWVINGAAGEPGGSGYITKVQAITEVEAQSHRIALQIYTKYPTCEMDDNAPAVSPNTDDEPYFEDEVELPALHARGDGSYAVATPGTVGNLPLAFTCEPGSRDLYFLAIAVDATTHSATEKLTFKFKIERVKTVRD